MLEKGPDQHFTLVSKTAVRSRISMIRTGHDDLHEPDEIDDEPWNLVLDAHTISIDKLLRSAGRCGSSVQGTQG